MCLKSSMVVIHTEAVAIFNGQLINEAEDKIQYVKYRPSQPFDSNTPINFTIPGNSSQYIDPLKLTSECEDVFSCEL